MADGTLQGVGRVTVGERSWTQIIRKIFWWKTKTSGRVVAGDTEESTFRLSFRYRRRRIDGLK